MKTQKKLLITILNIIALMLVLVTTSACKQNSGSGKSSGGGVVGVLVPDLGSKSVAAPSNLIAIPYNNGIQNGIQLSWEDKAINESGFKIERALSNAGPFSTIYTAAANAVSYFDSSVSTPSTYYYRVTAYTSKASSSSNVDFAIPGPTDVTAPSIPGNVSAFAVSSSRIDVSWNVSSDTGGAGLKGYNIYRDGNFLKLVAAPALSASDLQVSLSTNYKYVIKAVDKAGNLSAASLEVSANTGGCVTKNITVGVSVLESLDTNGCFKAVGSYMDKYEFIASSGNNYHIAVQSADFYAKIDILNAYGVPLASLDSGSMWLEGGWVVYANVHVPYVNGAYTIQVYAQNAGEQGNYTLSVTSIP